MATDWKTAVDQCRAFRHYLESKPEIPHEQKTKAYHLRREDIDALLKQDGKDLAGIRIYIGHENYGGTADAVRFYAVATSYNSEKSQYDDYGVPDDANSAKNLASLGTVRPCPRECGTDNILNHD